MPFTNAGDLRCTACMNCGPFDHIIDIVVMEHGLHGDDSNLESISESILNKFYSLHSPELWHHVTASPFDTSSLLCVQSFLPGSNRMKSCHCHHRTNEHNLEIGAPNPSTLPSCHSSNEEVHSNVSSRCSGCSECLPACPHHVLILNHPGNNGWKTFWSVESCAQRLSTFVVKNVQAYIKRLQSKLKSLSCSPFAVSREGKTYEKTDAESSHDSPVFLHEDAIRSVHCDPIGVEEKMNKGRGNAISKRNCCPSGSSPFTSAVAPECAADVLRRSSYPVATEKWKLKFHFVGFSMGGIILRAALPTIIRKIRKMFPKMTDCSSMSGIHFEPEDDLKAKVCTHKNRKIGSCLSCKTALVKEKRCAELPGSHSPYPHYDIIWRSFFSLSCPHLGSRVPHPMLRKTYNLISRLDRFCVAPRGVSDLVLLSTYLEKELLKPAYLRALKIIEKKYFIGSMEDEVVWNYSSCFILPPRERRLLEEWVPVGPLCINVGRRVLQLQFHEASKAVLQPVEFNDAEREERRRRNTENNDNRRGQKEGEEMLRSSDDGPFRNDTQRGLYSAVSVKPSLSSRTQQEHNETNESYDSDSSWESLNSRIQHSMLQSIREGSWVDYTVDEQESLTSSLNFFSKFHLRPASCLAELRVNNVTVTEASEEEKSLKKGEEGMKGTAEREKTSMRGGAALETDHASEGCSTSIQTSYSSWISEERWPAKYLSRERRMAEVFLKGIGPIEIYLVDMRQAATNFLDLLAVDAIKKGKIRELNPKLLAYIVNFAYSQTHGLILCGESPSGSVPSRYKPLSRRRAAQAQAEQTRAESVGAVNQSGETGNSPLLRRLVAHEHQEEKLLLPFNFVALFVAERIFESTSLIRRSQKHLPPLHHRQ